MPGCDELIEEIKDRLITARSLEDTEGILRGLKDLESIGWENISVVSGYIGLNGERLEFKTWLSGGACIIAPGTTRVFKLIWLLRFKDMVTKSHYRWVKHENDMSPEEYDWVHC